MGTKTVKKASQRICEDYGECIASDYSTNKRIIAEVAEIQTKRLRNKIAGFVTHCSRVIQSRANINVGDKKMPITLSNNSINKHSKMYDKDTADMLRTIEMTEFTTFVIHDSEKKNIRYVTTKCLIINFVLK